jgi:hypothetical protein
MQGFGYEELKENSRDSPSFDPHALATDGNGRKGIKKGQ